MYSGLSSELHKNFGGPNHYRKVCFNIKDCYFNIDAWASESVDSVLAGDRLSMLAGDRLSALAGDRWFVLAGDRLSALTGDRLSVSSPH